MRVRLCLVVAVACLLSAGVRGDAGGCQDVEGDFTSTLVPPPACTSPIGICTHGLLTGEVEGTYDFVMTELDCPVGAATCTYAGDSIVTTEKGTIVTADTGVMDNTFPTANFTTTAEFVSGTLRYRNATGVFVATGVLNFLTGEAEGTYTLEVCHGN